MNDQDESDIQVQPTLFGSDDERRVLINGRMAATIQRRDGSWRVMIPFGNDHEAHATLDAAVDAVVKMRRCLNANELE